MSTIKLLQWQFQAFIDVSLFEKLIWKSCRSQNKTSIRGASLGISYKLWDKDAIGRWSWYIVTQERKICDMEIEIVTFVIKSWKYEVDRPSQSTKVNPGKKEKYCSLSCLWSQVQRGSSDQGNSQTLCCLWTKNHQCTFMWNWTGKPTASCHMKQQFPVVESNIFRVFDEKGY